MYCQSTLHMRVCRFVLVCILALFMAVTLANSVCAASYPVSGKSYELTDGSVYSTSGQNSKNQLCYGAGSIGSLNLSGAVNAQSVYKGWNAIGATGEVSLTYSYHGEYQSDQKEQWNLSTSNEKAVNGIDLDKKVKMGAVIVERSSDGRKWETVMVSTNVFHKQTADIAEFYTISEEDIRAGSFFRVSVAYRMTRKTGTENYLGFIPVDTYEYREFIEIMDFYICFNEDPVQFRDIETGRTVSEDNFCRGFIIDKCGTSVGTVIKDINTGVEKEISDLTSVMEAGKYRVTITTNLGKKYTYDMTVTEGMEMTAISPVIHTGDDYNLDGATSETAPFGMDSLTTVKIGHQADTRIASGNVSGFRAYGIMGDSVSLYIRIKNFSNPETNGWSITYDSWGKKEKQTVGGTWAGVVDTGALVIQISEDGQNWTNADQGKYRTGLSTTAFFTHYHDQGDVLMYTPDGEDLQQGLYIRVMYAYQVNQSGAKDEMRILEAYEMYLCSNELGAVTFHNLSASGKIQDKLGLDNETDIKVYRKAESLISGSGTVTGFSIDKFLNPTVQYTIKYNGKNISPKRDNRYTETGKYEIRLKSAVGTEEIITIYVDSRSNRDALKHYFGDGFIAADSKRIYSEGKYPVYEGGLTTLHIEPDKMGYLPIYGVVENLSTGNSFELTSGTAAVDQIIEEPGRYAATFTTRPMEDESPLPGDYRVFTFHFEIIAEGSAPGPVVNKESLARYAMTSATDSRPMFYGLIYSSAAGGNITLAFATKEAAVDYAYNYEKGTVEKQPDGTFRYTGSFILSQKEKYNSAWDLTDAMYYFAEQAVQVMYFDLTDQFTYLTLPEKVIQNTRNLRTLELERSVTIFADEQREPLCTLDALPIISPKPYAYLSSGLNGKVDTGYLDFEFIRDKYGCDSSSVVIIDSTGKEYRIAYHSGVGKQLAAAGCPSGVVTIKEQTVYGDVTSYEAVYIAEGDNTAAISLISYADGRKKETSYTQADDGISITADAFELSGFADLLDPFALVTVTNETTNYRYVASQLATGAWSSPGDYKITVTNRLGYAYSINITIIESDYASIVFEGEGTDTTKAIITQFGEKNITLPGIKRYGYTLVGFEDETGHRYTNEIDEIMFKGTTVLNTVWEAKQYAVHFRDSAGTEIAAPMTVEFGREYELPSLRVEDGIVFLGWARNGEIISSSELAVDQEGDIVLVASFDDPNYVFGQTAEDDSGNHGLLIVVLLLVSVGTVGYWFVIKGRKCKKAQQQKRIEETAGGDQK